MTRFSIRLSVVFILQEFANFVNSNEKAAEQQMSQSSTCCYTLNRSKQRPHFL